MTAPSEPNYMEKPNSILLLSALIFLAAGLSAQIDTPTVSPASDVRDLYRRAAASEYVVTGTVTGSRVVFRRTPQGDVAALRAAIDTGGEGQEFTVSVDKVLCQQSDFAPSPKSSDTLKQEVKIFVPKTGPHFSGPYREEYLIRGERYLLFLTPLSESQKALWASSLELDPDSRYFRTLEYSRRAIALASDPILKGPPIFEKVTKLCEAVRPTAVSDKLAALHRLENSGDAVLAKEAKAAAEGLMPSNRK